MMRNYCGQVLLALLLCSPNEILGFSTIQKGSSRSTVLRASPGETTLELKGVVEVSSNPLPSLPADKMASFFESREIRNMLVTAGGKRPCEELSAAGAILEEWKEACSVVGAQLPDESDSPLSVKTGGIDFPGLHLTSKAKIGAKLVQEPSPSPAPNPATAPSAAPYLAPCSAVRPKPPALAPANAPRATRPAGTSDGRTAPPTSRPVARAGRARAKVLMSPRISLSNASRSSPVNVDLT